MASKSDHKIVLSAKDQTKSALKSVKYSLGQVKKSVFSLQNAVGILAGGAGFGALAKNALDTVDSLSKTAAKIGTTTESLAGLRHAAELTGVSSKTMDMALQRFTRRLSEARQGTGAAKDALKELNLDANKLAGLPLDQQMLELSRAFSGVGQQSDRVRLAMKLFDSEGVALVNTLALGSDGLSDAAREARDLGIAIDQTRASQIEAFNDSLYKLKQSVNGAFIQAMGDAAPELKELSDSLRDKMKPAIKGVINGFKWILDNLDSIKQAIKAFLFVLAASKLYAFAGGLFAIFKQLVLVARAAKISGKALLKSVVGVALVAAVTIAEITGTLDKLLDKLGMSDKAGGEFAKVIRETNELMNQAKEPVNIYVEGMTRLGSEALSLKQILNISLNNALDSVTNGLTDVVVGTKKAADAFKDMANSIIRDMIRMQIQQQITEPLSIAIGSAFGTQPAAVNTPAAPNVAGAPLPMKRARIPGEGVTINQSVNISAGVSQTVRAEVQSLMPQIANASKMAVLDAKQRGGTFAGAF